MGGILLAKMVGPFDDQGFLSDFQNLLVEDVSTVCVWKRAISQADFVPTHNPQFLILDG